MPYLHGVGPQATRWGFFFVWTLFALGVTGAFTAILALHALWHSFRASAKRPRLAVPGFGGVRIETVGVGTWRVRGEGPGLLGYTIGDTLTECDSFGIPSTSHWTGAAITVK
jgi:H+/Cl- antiporter ClcA